MRVAAALIWREISCWPYRGGRGGQGFLLPSPSHIPPPPTFRYKEVVETVLRFKDSKEKQIRRAVIVLLPRLAAFSPERFAAEYAAKALSHLIR